MFLQQSLRSTYCVPDSAGGTGFDTTMSTGAPLRGRESPTLSFSCRPRKESPVPRNHSQIPTSPANEARRGNGRGSESRSWCRSHVAERVGRELPRARPPHWLPLRSQPWRRCVAQIGSSEEVRISRRMSEPSFLLITTHKVGINILVFQLKKPRLSEVK